MGRHGKRVAMRPRYCLRKLPDASPSIWVTDKCPRPCSRTSAVCFLPLLKLCAQLRRLADDNGTFPISSISTKRSVEPFKNRFTSLFLDVFFFFKEPAPLWKGIPLRFTHLCTEDLWTKLKWIFDCLDWWAEKKTASSSEDGCSNASYSWDGLLGLKVRHSERTALRRILTRLQWNDDMKECGFPLSASICINTAARQRGRSTAFDPRDVSFLSFRSSFVFSSSQCESKRPRRHDDLIRKTQKKSYVIFVWQIERCPVKKNK